MEDKPILSVKDLRIAFQSIDGFNSVVHNIAFDVFENEIILEKIKPFTKK